MGSRPSFRFWRAFTLVELLVVIAILALLISILLPALNKARKQARRTVCLTNLRAMGEAANFYADDNNDYVVRGTICLASQSNIARGCPGGAGTFATALLRYLHKDGSRWNGETQRWLWEKGGFPRMNEMHKVYGETPQFRCPERGVEKSNLDYISNAMPLPFSRLNANASDADMQWRADGRGEEADVYNLHYEWTSRRSHIGRTVNPGQLIFITEGHRELMTLLPENWQPCYSLFAFYLASQLPFAGVPRIANDGRHQGTINSLYFDGHADNRSLHAMDPGWPNTIGVRLWLFSPLAADVRDQ